MDPVLSRDARTSQPRAQVAVEAGPAEVDAAVRAAHATLGALSDRHRRAELLRAAAEAVESRADALIAAADAETALGVPRLAASSRASPTSSVSSRNRRGRAATSASSSTRQTPPPCRPRPELRRWEGSRWAPSAVVSRRPTSPFAFKRPGRRHRQRSGGRLAPWSSRLTQTTRKTSELAAAAIGPPPGRPA